MLNFAITGLLDNPNKHILQLLRRLFGTLSWMRNIFQIMRWPRETQIQLAIPLINTDTARREDDFSPQR